MMYDCDGVDFDGLRNPYTGKRVRTKMLVMPDGRALFGAPGEYSPGVHPCATSQEAFRLWDRVDGREGLRAAAGPVVCAWTGEPLRPRKTDRGWTLEGGFDPSQFRPREEYLHFMKMRGGRSPRPLPAEAVRATQPAPEPRVTAAHRRGVEERAAKPDEDTARAAADALKAAGAKSPTVGMHVPSGRWR